MLWGNQTFSMSQVGCRTTSPGSHILSLASFVTSRGLLELEEGPASAEGRHGLVGHAEGQAGGGVDAGVAKVKSGAAAAAEA